MALFTPAYIPLFESGSLKQKAAEATGLLENCTLCPRRCEVNRLSEETGICKTGRNAIVASFNAHFGEEAPLVGQHGSGTIFFAMCNLKCRFCQNYEISQEGCGRPVAPNQMAHMMLSLQEQGCHNINFVTPSHVVPQILEALLIAVPSGLTVPLVYNSGGYDSTETLRLLEGVIDIYMPDFKFWDPAVAQKLAKAKDYPAVAREALKEMHRQVGDLAIDSSGVATSGLLVRHLVLPSGLAGTREVMKFLADEISTDTYVNVMSQYHPAFKAHEIEGIKRTLTDSEYETALREAEEAGITRLDKPGFRFYPQW